MGVDDDNLSLRMSNCSSSPAGADKVASRLARARCRDNHRLAAPVEGQRDGIRLSGTACGRNPDVDLSPQPHERVLDPLVTRPHDRRSSDAYRRQCRLLGRRTTGRHPGERGARLRERALARPSRAVRLCAVLTHYRTYTRANSRHRIMVQQ
jgi:hypothetical protein